MRYLLLALALTAVPLDVSAHALGASYEATVDGYFIDIGFSSPAPEVGESVIFDFNFPATQEPIPPYTDVWVRVEKERRVMLASALHNAHFGGPRMSYVFPEAGTYTIYVRYQNAEETFVETEFTMPVVPARVSVVDRVLGNPGYIVGGVGVLIALSALAYTNRARLFSRLQKRG